MRVLARGTPWVVPTLWVTPLLARRPPARLALVAAAAAVTWFFRDPERHPDGPGVLAAADGVVRSVTQGSDGRWTVSTYLDLRDVHVTRAPCDAVVTVQARRRGRHHRAGTPASAHNHRVEWILATRHGPGGLTQYAGLVARRIVTYRGPGERIGRGERVGLIRFGSRVDVLLPQGVSPAVPPGARLRAGATVIGRADVP